MFNQIFGIFICPTAIKMHTPTDQKSNANAMDSELLYSFKIHPPPFLQAKANILNMQPQYIVAALKCTMQ